MRQQVIFNFKRDISEIEVPVTLNNPFGGDFPEIARIAASEFQQFIGADSEDWDYDFKTQKGKMFGVLVIQKADKTLGYIGAISGKLPSNATANRFVPSIFDDATDDFFINKGMKELKEIGSKINSSNNQREISRLTERRKQKSFALQQRLFENYRFLNLLGKEKNALQIFLDFWQGNPPSAAGECAAPKLLQFAFKQELKPVAMAEFWWGNPRKSTERKHLSFYPACKNKCRPILEFMLNDNELFNKIGNDIVV